MMFPLSRSSLRTLCLIMATGFVYDAKASEDCAHWTVSRLEQLTFKAIEAQKTTFDKTRILPGELETVVKSALYSPASPGWYLEFRVLRENPSQPIFISLVSCNTHVEFGSRSRRANETSK